MAGRNLTILGGKAAADGGFLFVGCSSNGHGLGGGLRGDSLKQFYLLKVDAGGKTQWEWEYGADASEELLTDITFAGDTIVVAGVQDERLYVAKLKVDVAEVERARSDLGALQIAPNPVGERARITASLPHSGTVRVELVDVEGRTVREMDLGVRHIGECVESVALGELVPGRYVLRLLLDNAVISSGGFVRE